MRKFRFVIFSLLLTSIISCDKASNSVENGVRQKFVGTWLSEIDFEDAKTRAVTNIDEGGAFQEIEKIFDNKGNVIETSYAGEWSFDGKNFKRKYMKKDGRALPNSEFEYATYAVSMVGSDKFMGADNIQKKTVKFIRTSVGSAVVVFG